MVFRLAGALLLVALVCGQIWQHRPAGALTRLLLAAIAEHCPAAASRARHSTIADGAHALDRAVFRLLTASYRLRSASRCGG